MGQSTSEPCPGCGKEQRADCLQGFLGTSDDACPNMSKSETPDPDADERPPPLYCSFCGKTQWEVCHMIAGPTVFICDECIDICCQIISDKRGAVDGDPEYASWQL